MRAPVVIIGGGISGLACATTLHKAGIPFQLFESGNRFGGRVGSSEVDGYLLDHGFQVYLSAYQNAGRLLDLDQLDLHHFLPGAQVWKSGKLREVIDVFRHPLSTLKAAAQPIGTFKDKWLVAQLRFHLLSLSELEIWMMPDIPTERFLKQFGFSDQFINDFFRSFYGGIFLESDLTTSARMFAFTFNHFSRGHASLPARGMQEIPNQLVNALPEDALHLQSPVRSIDETGITTDSDKINAENIVVATDPNQWFSAKKTTEWNATTCLYFSAEIPPISKPLIVLKGDRKGCINNLCVPSLVSTKYAPKGKHLISVSLIGSHETEAILNTVTTELGDWFGPQVQEWQHLKTMTIRKSLPKNPPGHFHAAPDQGPVWFCGDHTTSGSIDGAVMSGVLTANRIIKN